MTENSRIFFVMGRPLLTIAVLAALAIAGTFLFVPVFQQNPDYHHFADSRSIAGIPNFWNVVSNLPFLLIGVLSLATIRRNVPATFFGIGLVLTAFGSSLYHLAPNDGTLLYDRLGIVIAVVPLIAMLAEEHELAVLVIAEAIGIGSIVWWELNGDLRLYGVVQFFPGLLILVLPLLVRSRYSHRAILGFVLVFYAIAKACELYDRQMFDALQFVSGHTLKHLAAAASTFAIWWWLRKRQPIAVVESSPPVSGVRSSSPARETTT
jgi:hypothetical protein